MWKDFSMPAAGYERQTVTNIGHLIRARLPAVTCLVITGINQPTLIGNIKVTAKVYIVKLREREGQRVDLGRSLKGHLWMVDGGYPFPDALH